MLYYYSFVAYHCELNPIEMIWAQLKMYVRKRNTTSKIKDVERLVHEGIDSITPEAWKNCIRHVIDQENYFWEKDSELAAYENDELEDEDFGYMDEVLAGDVAAAIFNNPSSKLKTSKFSICINKQLIVYKNPIKLVLSGILTNRPGQAFWGFFCQSDFT